MTTVAAAAAFALAAPPAPAQPPAMTAETDIDMVEMMSGNYTFRKVIESGRHLFEFGFNTKDGYGEGPDGPRRSYQQLTAAPGFPYLRLNGLDSQSCFECHNTIGTQRLPDTLSNAQARKVGPAGGTAGSASNAFINPGFPKDLTQLIRNPPHVFGIGYGQQLAEEMSLELMGQRASARLMAMMTPDTPVSVPLSSKGTEFGAYTVTFDSTRAASAPAPPRLEAAVRGGGAFVEDYSAVEGVSIDLIVRPFQWKGIASTERNFVRDAANFHFGIEAEELYYALDDMGKIIITDEDHDRDGKANELSPGNVTALTVFTASVRPPAQIVTPGTEAEVARGEAIFLGTATDVVPMGTQTCASCHTPSLTLNDSAITVIDPTNPDNHQRVASATPGLSVPIASSDELPVARRFARLVGAMDATAADKPEEFAGAVVASARAGGGFGTGYQFDLTDMPMSIPLSYPRLFEDQDGSIEVPLFSDLRRHRMGDDLRDPVRQGTDAAGIEVPEDQFLTRPLWGVGDTGPWMHDGRATTLAEAIRLHASNGSEANEVVATFDAMGEADQEALITFLLSLRLPLERTFDFSRTQSGLYAR